MIKQDLIDILVCPESKQPVSLADDTLIASLNSRIAAGTLINNSGDAVKEPLESGLIRQDGKRLYPIRKDIPVMLIDEGIPL